VSSTNRGAARVTNDYYPTPAWAVRAILPWLIVPGVNVRRRILEPACGEGAIANEIVAHGIPATSLTLVDVSPLADAAPRPDGARYERADFLQWAPAARERGEQFDLIITNPPYTLALEFVQAALTLAGPTGRVVMLLRLNFLGSQKRAAWMRAHTPDIFVLPKRPSFVGQGTDSCEYAWFRWWGTQPDDHGRVRVLELPTEGA
jgi:predicted RNA methylase